MNTRLAETSWAPWAGLFIGALAWGAHHQFGSNLVYLRCSALDRQLVVVIGATLLAVATGATFLSWLSRRAGQPTEHAVEMRRFTAWISTAGGGLFALAIALQTAAGLLAPTCAP
ncbi:MAG TPA: hypothetical protein VEF55_01715 [Candidatus Binatia bacterium]|nr:hypothetical protein [Candidatus Binatia bacterium]